MTGFTLKRTPPGPPAPPSRPRPPTPPPPHPRPVDAEAVLGTVGERAFVVERAPAAHDRFLQRVRTDHVQDGLVLASERCGAAVFVERGRAHRNRGRRESTAFA